MHAISCLLPCARRCRYTYRHSYWLARTQLVLYSGHQCLPYLRPICFVQPMAFMTMSAKCALGRLVKPGKENFLLVHVSSW